MFTNFSQPSIIVTKPSPVIFFTDLAVQKMKYIVDICKEEVGWLSSVVQKDNIYVVTDVFLFDQEVHGTTCEISPESLAVFANEIMDKPQGDELYNSIRLWGHSHVNMSPSPSAQDNEQIKTFAADAEWFIRLIMNKKGEIKIDFYDFKSGINYLDLPFKQLETPIEGLKESIQAEIEKKVKKKTYTPTTYPSTMNGSGNYYGNYYSSHYGGKAITKYNISCLTQSAKDEILETTTSTVYTVTRKVLEENNFNISCFTLATAYEVYDWLLKEEQDVLKKKKENATEKQKNEEKSSTSQGIKVKCTCCGGIYFIKDMSEVDKACPYCNQ